MPRWRLVKRRKQLPSGAHRRSRLVLGAVCRLQEAIDEMVVLRAQGRPLRAIADAVKAKGVQISHQGVAGVLRAWGA
jgi:hypothetical protein